MSKITKNKLAILALAGIGAFASGAASAEMTVQNILVEQLVLPAVGPFCLFWSNSLSSLRSGRSPTPHDRSDKFPRGTKCAPAERSRRLPA